MTDIIVFGEDYGVHPSSTQHLMNRLAENHRIIWLNSIGLRAPHLKLSDIIRIARKAMTMLTARLKSSPPSTSGDVTPFPVLQPFALPFPNSQSVRTINRFLLTRQLRKLIGYYALQQPVLWTSLPSAVDAICPEMIRTLYYCGDDFSALEGVDHQAIAVMEQELIQQADLVISASESLHSRMPHEKRLYLPHGVDIELFIRPSPCPLELQKTRKRACFYGSIASWVRLDWIAFAAQQLPEWDFILIGNIKADVQVLKKQDNIIFTGPKPHDELVAYASHCDILLMPFADNEQIRHCNPLKLYEYLALGKPIVTTQFPAIEPYQSLLHIADSPEGFVTCLQEALKEGDAGQHQRQQAVQWEDWNQRAEKLEKWL
ncbi:MAG: glycosyltransferase [Rickettsiales bacterium]|nr:glycosyltransferase [Rickettsiales bacterium]